MLEICLGNKTDTALYGAELIRLPGSICEFFFVFWSVLKRPNLTPCKRRRIPASRGLRRLTSSVGPLNVTMNTPLILLYAVKVILTLCEKQLFTKLLELLRLLLNLYLSLEKETQNIINGARKPKRTLGSWKNPSEKLLHGKLPLIKNIFTVFGFISRSLNFPHKCCAKKN